MTGMDDRSQPISTTQYTLADGEVGADVAWINYWRKAFVYSGRATRAEYNWAFAQFLVIGLIVWALIYGLASNHALRTGLGVALLLVFIVPWLALISRRCHDINRRGTFGLWLLATNFGFLVTQGFLIFGRSDPRGARFDALSTHPGLDPSQVVPHSDLSK